MCGGRGTRLDADTEKPLLDVAGRPMVDRVCDALAGTPASEANGRSARERTDTSGPAGSRVGRVVAAVSPHTPATREHLRERPDVTVVETPGEGYVADLDAALAAADLSRPVLTCVADLPLLAGDLVEDVLDAHAERAADSLTVAVPVALKRDLGVSVDTTFEHEGRDLAPTGLNVLGDDEGSVLVLPDERLAVNVNRAGDAAVARSSAGR